MFCVITTYCGLWPSAVTCRAVHGVATPKLQTSARSCMHTRPHTDINSTSDSTAHDDNSQPDTVIQSWCQELHRHNRQHHDRASITASIITTTTTPTSAQSIANNGNQHQQSTAAADKRTRRCDHAPCNQVVIAWASRRLQYARIPLHAHPQVRHLPVRARHSNHL